MIRSVPGKLFLLFSMALLAFTVKAQKVHFIYLQTEGGQPFYAKFNNKLISSSSEGYIIIPSVPDGVYNLIVGFPRNEFPEKDYKIEVDNTNEGFLLKNLDEKGWQLFNMETLSLTKGDNTKLPTMIVKKDEDPFTKMLAGVVKDSSILQNHDTITVASAKTIDSSKKINADTSKSIASNTQEGWKIYPPLSALDSNTKKHELPPSIAAAPSVTPMKKDSQITQILNESDQDGMVMIYEVKDDSSKTDTVSIFIPIQKSASDSDNAKNAVSDSKNIPSSLDSSHVAGNVTTTNTLPQGDSSVKTPVSPTSIDTAQKNNSLHTNSGNVVAQTPVSVLSVTDSSAKGKDSIITSDAEEKKDTVATALSKEIEPTKEIKDSSSPANINTPQITTSNVTGSPTNATQDHPPSNQLIVLPQAVTISRVNSDCKNFASTEDFLKLRKKMAAEVDMDNMLKIAMKYFKAKCYSTEQIKDLSYLFLSDEGKYKFFDEAFAFTSDSDQYQILQSQFTDKYYLNRFKAMIGK
ncbi:MAG: hypothetical protein ABI185_04535 [Ginsengibacter sp.]